MKRKQFDGVDVTDRVHVCIHPDIFYPLRYRPIALVAIVFASIEDMRVFASFNATLSTSNLEVYNLCISSPDGLTVGHLFSSPLAARVDLHHALFFRRTIKAKELVTSMSVLPKRTLSKNVVFHGNDVMHYIVLRKTRHPLLTFISGEEE